MQKYINNLTTGKKKIVGGTVHFEASFLMNLERMKKLLSLKI